jgi:hypothetical protein
MILISLEVHFLFAYSLQNFIRGQNDYNHVEMLSICL